MARHVRGNLDVIARHSYVEYDAGHRREELSLGLSMHEDESSGTCYVMSLTRAALMAYGSEPHDLLVVASVGPGEGLYGLSPLVTALGHMTTGYSYFGNVVLEVFFVRSDH